MTFLLLQTFLLLLAAYFLGAFLACLVRRSLTVAEPAYQQAPLARQAAAGRALNYPAAERPLPGAAYAPQLRPPMPAPQVVRPRVIDPVQPKIDILPRPAPRPVPKVADIARFDRALWGPELNEGMPRIAVVEIRPAVLKPVTGPALPWVPKPPPEDVPVIAGETPAGTSVESVKAARNETTKDAPKEARPVPARTFAIGGALANAAAAAATAAVTAAKTAAAKIAPPKGSEEAPPDAVNEGTATVKIVKSDPRASGNQARDAEPVPSAKSAPAPVSKPVTTPSPATRLDDPKSQAVEASPKEAPAPPITGGDDLQRIRAIDAAAERGLKGLGVLRFEDIARWTPADINRLNQALGLAGRIDREQWIEQAQILAKGGETYYSRNRAAAAKTTQAKPAEQPTASAPDVKTAPVASIAPPPAKAMEPAAKPEPAKISSNPIPVATQTKVASEPAPETVPPKVEAQKPRASQQSVAAEGAASAPVQGRSVSEIAAAAAAAIAAASASVTRGIRPIEPMSPLSKADPKIVMAAKLSDAIRDKEAKSQPHSDPEGAKQATLPEKARAVSGDTEDLKRIRGVGVLIEKRLNGLGITRYEQIANWTSGDIDRISQQLEFKGRIERENWVEQARILSSGGQTEFSRRVDRGEVETSRDS